METYVIKKNIEAFGFRVKTFPEGIGEAFDSLIEMVPEGLNRSYYGISYMTPENEAVYIAAVEEKNKGEGRAGLSPFSNARSAMAGAGEWGLSLGHTDFGSHRVPAHFRRRKP